MEGGWKCRLGRWKGDGKGGFGDGKRTEKGGREMEGGWKRRYRMWKRGCIKKGYRKEFKFVYIL